MTTVLARRRFDPFADVDAFFRSAFPATRPTGFAPAAEVVRDGDDAVVRIEVPGIDPARDVTVEVDRGHLVVRGERRDEHVDSEHGRTVREVRYGSFSRRFALPEHVTGEHVSASYDAGILSVRVAGVHAGATPTRIPVASAAATVEGGDEGATDADAVEGAGEQGDPKPQAA